MNERDILEQTRKLLREHAGEDADKWWYANRFVFARLALDERQTKVHIKRRLIDSGAPCHHCGKRFETPQNLHLHRLDGDRGYSEGNCVLMHAQCHRDAHAARKPTAGRGDRRRITSPVLTKSSKAYDDKTFLYWWDISTKLLGEMERYEAVEFVKKDTRERCVLPVNVIKPLLVPERQTTRGGGNWGIKVLPDRPNELALEPGSGRRDWEFIPIVWMEPSED